MPHRTGKDSDKLRELLAQVRTLREEVEDRAKELRQSWDAGTEKDASRALNLSRYVALRGQDLADLQLRLAARGLSSLGRCEAKVAPALDALIATLRRLTGETEAE